MQYREISYKNEEEWHGIRQKHIGGSDCSIIMGHNPYNEDIQELWRIKTGKNKYKNIIDVWKDKTGRVQNNFTSPAAQRGKNLEKNIFNSYKEDHPDKKILEVNKMYIHPKYDFIRANLDGEIIYQDKKGILEIKTATISKRNKYVEEWQDNIPKSYLYQILHYFLVIGYEYAVVVSEIKFECFKNENSTPFDLDKRLQTIVINRVDWEDEIQELLNKEIEFWECVKNDTEPRMIKTYGG